MKHLIFILLLFTTFSASAQWECKSKMGSHLKPIANSNLLWASELATSAGYLSNNAISSAMGFIGLDYTQSNHSLYFEGGIKYWNKYDLDSELKYDNYRLGVREAFYKFSSNASNLTVGLHSATLSDDYLLNERVLGATYKYSKNNIQINFTAGTVTNDFSRNGKFCSSCFLYDIIPNRPMPVIGSNIGETNLAGVRINFTPKLKKEPESEKQTTEDEFEFFSDDFVEEESTSIIYIKEYGALIYTEFQRQFDNPFANAGFYLKLNTKDDMSINTEVLVQGNSSSLGLITTVSIEKNFFWDNAHKSSVLISYYGFNEISGDAVPLNSYSNILAGKVLRLDAPELPIYLVSLKHNIPSLKAHVKCQYALSTYSDSMQEFDLQIGKTFFSQLQISAIGAYIQSDLIPVYHNTYLAQVEARYSF